MARNRLNSDQDRRASELEQDARTACEESHGHPLSDEEWSKQRSRLLEYIMTLARWDQDQREPRKPASMASKPEKRKLA